ncbi:hypothetical protein FB390_2734 [Nocardia bhagyanarayanae]|uniref:Uncharacterized protein n=1 Tax=Nocardia bhagyanarayanae TaxID=1215925 RepID=A0A543FBC2_9NOCA|nr:hypothetical protein FB390_2734 [Nocardia bhagyanarayanae]
MCLRLSDHVPPLRFADRLPGGEATKQCLGALLVKGVVIHRAILARGERTAGVTNICEVVAGLPTEIPG